MGTSVFQCPLCREYYREFFLDKRKMPLLVRIHRSHATTYEAGTVRSQETEGLGA